MFLGNFRFWAHFTVIGVIEHVVSVSRGCLVGGDVYKHCYKVTTVAKLCDFNRLK